MWLELVFFSVALALYFLYTLWSERAKCGFPYLPYKFPFGPLTKVLAREKTFGLAINDFYSQQSDHPLVGVPMIFTSTVLVRDPEIVKMVLTSHFENFSDRGLYPDKMKKSLRVTLFSLEVDEWRSLRAKLTPAFSSGKLKQMFGQIQDISHILQNEVQRSIEGKPGTLIELKDLSSRFIVDILGSTIFGIDVNSITDADHPFRNLGKQLSKQRNSSVWEAIRFGIMFLFPRASACLGIGNLPKFLSSYFIELVRTTMEHRERHSITRQDVMQQLLLLRNTGTLAGDDSKPARGDPNSQKFLTIEECAANSFLFYVAGSESSSSSICFCLYELCRAPQHLATLQEEIDRVLHANKGQMTYEALKDMKFLEKCIYETIRMYPALPMLNRRCTKDFQVPGTAMKILRNQSVVIPLRAIQTDEKYFPNPLIFNPNRCDPQDEDYSTVPYYVFGDGPKSCIAFRLGIVMVKAGLVSILSRCNIALPSDDYKLEFAIGDLGMSPKDGFKLRLSLRENN